MHANGQVGAIFTGVDAFAILFFFPETQFFHPTVSASDGNSMSNEPNKSTEAKTDEPISPSKKSYLQELNPLPTIDRSKNYLLQLLKPIPIILYPATIFSFLTFASTLGFLVAAITTAGAVFQSPPYNMTPAISGLINVPSFIGNLIGSYCGGGFTDRIAQWQARRNNGVFEPEARLVALIIPFFLVPAGLLMYVG